MPRPPRKRPVSRVAREPDRDALFRQLFAVVRDLGWSIGVPDDDSDNEVPGLIVGSAEYVAFVTAALDAYGERPPWKTGH